ncbi:MAG: hypothetical protein ABL977_04945 [Candidatus Eisenbacteria bacterium]
MNKKLGTPNGSNDRFEQTLQLASERGRQRQRAMIGAWVGGTAIAMVATIALLEGCSGGDSTKLASSIAEPPAGSSQQAVVASSDGLASGQGTVPYAQPVDDPETLKSVPPDVIVAASDTFVTAGQPIEVKVEGTEDITEMALSDGRGDALPMVRDSSGQVWRVNYRVPLRPKTDRLGLAVTAKNESNRWRRVWLFLQVDNGKQQVETETPDEMPSEK